MRLPFDYDYSKVSKGKVGEWLRNDHSHFSEIRNSKINVVRHYNSNSTIPESLINLNKLIEENIYSFYSTGNRNIFDILGFTCNFIDNENASCYLKSEYSMVWYNNGKSYPSSKKKEDRYIETTEISIFIKNKSHITHYKTTYIPRTYFQ